MKQRTKWIYKALYNENNFIRVGYVYNKTKGNLKDVIRLQINGKNIKDDWFMRPDEAIIIIAGLSKVLAQMFVGQLPSDFSC